MSMNEQYLTSMMKSSLEMGSSLLQATSMALFTVMLIACSDQENKPSSQVAANVNDREITVHQVNNQLARSGYNGEVEVRQASRKILDSLIDQELLFEEALKNKLDRDPKVMQAVEDAKQQIIARAYIERMVYSRETATSEEVRDFFNKHPELFAKRKIFEFHTFIIAKDKFTEALKMGLDRSKTADETIKILNAQAIGYKEEKMHAPAEQVPLDLLHTIADIKTGDIIPLVQENQVAIMQLEHASDEPVDDKQAQAPILQHLAQTKNKQLLADKLKQLRASSQITYLGSFAEETTDTSAILKPAKEASPVLDPPANDYMKRGLVGLKQ